MTTDPQKIVESAIENTKTIRDGKVISQVAINAAVQRAVASLHRKPNPCPRGPVGKPYSERQKRRMAGQTNARADQPRLADMVKLFSGEERLDGGIASPRAIKRVSGGRTRA